MKTPHEFFEETNGKIIDVDGSYGGQCWDLFAKFCLEYCGKTFNCIETGYVIDLWTHFDDIGLGEYFIKVPNNAMTDGDWAIWYGPCMITNKSHIAMFRKDENNGGGIFLTQNPNGNPNYTHQMWISYEGLVGGLRPKCYIPKREIKEFSLTEVGDDYAKFHIVGDPGSFDWINYSLDDSNWMSYPIDNTIKNLQSNKTYKIKVECRNTGTDNWTISNYIIFTTKEKINNLNMPQLDNNDIDNINTLPISKTTENGIKEEKKEHYLNKSKKKKTLIEIILDFLFKLLNR